MANTNQLAKSPSDMSNASNSQSTKKTVVLEFRHPEVKKEEEKIELPEVKLDRLEKEYYSCTDEFSSLLARVKRKHEEFKGGGGLQSFRQEGIELTNS